MEPDLPGVSTYRFSSLEPIIKSNPTIKNEILRTQGTEFTWKVENIKPREAAKLRRIMMGQIPTVAIDCVEIYENTSIFKDEDFAQRLGLIPLTSSNISPLPFSKGCDCECPGLPASQCLKCSVVLNFAKSGQPGEIVYLTSQDLIPENETYQIKPVEYLLPNENGGTDAADILIGWLLPDQTVDIRCIVKKGIAVNHAKWSATTAVAFNQLDDGFLFKVGTTGSLSAKEIVDQTMKIYSQTN